MNDTQLAFFRALNAPFGQNDLFTTSKGGRTLTYVKAPTLMNRLDDVAGPAGWDVEYRPTERGYTCKLGILVPSNDEGTAVWHYKEDGGGFEGMTKSAGGEKIADDDNDEKSGYTNAFRRACYSWGMGRDLWRCGIPAYLGRDAVVPELPAPAPAPAARQPAAAPRQPAPAQRPAPSRPAGNGGGYDNFAPPRVNRGMYPWSIKLEEHFGEGIKKFSNAYAKQQGYPFKSVEWDDYMLEDVSWAVIDHVKAWENYQGEFDHLEDPRAGE